jgi:hypothetical protein
MQREPLSKLKTALELKGLTLVEGPAAYVELWTLSTGGKRLDYLAQFRADDLFDAEGNRFEDDL